MCSASYSHVCAKTFQHSCNFDFTAWKSHPDHWHSVLWDFTEMWSKLHKEQISTSVSDLYVEGHCWWWQLIAGSLISFLLKSALFPSMNAALQVGNKSRSMLSIFFFTISGPRICPPPKFCFINRRWRTFCGCYWTVACAAPYSEGYVTNTNWSHRQFSTDREKKSKWNTLVTQRLLTFNINLVGNRRHLSISGHSKLFWSCMTKTSKADWIIQGSIKSMHTLISNGWIGSSHLATSPDLGATLACMSKPHPWRFDVPPSLLLHPCMSNLKISRPSRS